MFLVMKMTMPIEDLWRQLAAGHPVGVQTRIDAVHPLDLYADFRAPDQVGLLAVCGRRPPEVRPMRALSVEQGRRTDGRWALRLSLEDRQLLPVFTALCRDIIECTRDRVDEARLGEVIVQRLLHWRTLLERESAGLAESLLRGLIGELIVLRDRLLPLLGPAAAVRAWRGPLGAPQDFVLPDGRRVEVKTVAAHARQVRINGLDQLDGGSDPLSLIVVRVETATAASSGAVSAPSLIAQLRKDLAIVPEDLRDFEAALCGLGWHEHPSHDEVIVKFVGAQDLEVCGDFPRIVRASVAEGVLDADYVIELPARVDGQGGQGT